MNIFTLELRKKIKSMLFWLAGILSWAIIVAVFIPTIVEQGQNYREILGNMGVFGEVINIDADTFSTVMGIVGMYFGMLLIVFGIQAANYGFGLVTIEESELTADFLITKPIRRTKILTAKIAASLVIMTVTCVLYIARTYYIIITVSDVFEVDKQALLLVLASAFFVQLFFFGIGLLVSLFMKKIKSVAPFSMGLVFSLYILSAFARTFEIDFLKYINPFSYFDTAQIAANANYDMTYFIINLCVAAVSIAAAYFLYQRRDIKSV